MNRFTRSTALHALAWAAVGAAAVLTAQRLAPRAPSLPDLAAEAAQRMGELGLDERQREELATIAQEWRVALLDHEQRWQRQVAELAAGADRRIEALLTPEQRERWRERASGGGDAR